MSGSVGDNVGRGSGIVVATAGGFEATTVMLFYQASAPTGWTQDTTGSLAKRTLNIVTGSGGGTGGTHDLDGAPSPAHTHTGPSHSSSNKWTGPYCLCSNRYRKNCCFCASYT